MRRADQQVMRGCVLVVIETMNKAAGLGTDDQLSAACAVYADIWK
jgi:hypothetical protein